MKAFAHCAPYFAPFPTPKSSRTVVRSGVESEKTHKIRYTLSKSGHKLKILSFNYVILC